MNLLVIFLLGITAVQGANILITYETARRSHQIWITQLAEALVAKGHNITLGGSFSRAIPASDEYHPITFEGIFMAHYKVNKTAHLFANPWRIIHLNHNYNYAICNKTYHSKGFNSLWNYPDNFTFDLILMDMTFGPCLYPLIERFGRPYTIGFTPSALTPYLSELFGNGGYPSYFASPILEPFRDQTFLDRLKNYLFTKFEIFFKKTFEQGAIEKLAESLLNRTFEFGELQKGISLLFVNEYPLLNAPKALTPNIIPLGGLHIRKLQPMPGILQSIIDNANQGFIFFSAGTDIQQNIFSPETKLLFANAFMNLSQKTIMWKDNIDDEDHPFNDRPSNILIHKWVPQNEILGHPHTKLFITTGGSLSIQEAIYHGVPVLGIPIYDEHHRNIQFIVDRHLGLKLDYNDLTEETISASINAILQNPIYLENMDQLAKKFRDQPQSPVQKAIYWIEYVLRHNATDGADFLTPKSRFSSFYGTYSTDVELFLLSAAILTTILTASLGIFTLLTILSNRSKSTMRGNKKTN
ncbi:UDP-glucosyltransferase 2 [Dendroctonus ponderosae]|uniref:UDP-glucosyltransferase 2 n=1 Tax=Dendroctonus ponderosae TaxID=77166 RepID=UPI0020359028|nr:UDP-glucosyltransferase 2 [Dendroctonus ponderosae]